jgi:hypothetical protein
MRAHRVRADDSSDTTLITTLPLRGGHRVEREKGAKINGP